MRKLKRRNLVSRNKKSIISKSGKENIALDELVTIFNEEAYKICRNRQIAKLIALNTLQEYVLKHTKNLTIIL
ncbi:MAG: hypothetical protein GY777_21720 [Candidatus Brocadiaceae bacterium]|nr:hypothetical protein [Candidatus Brocadiaceae bacterium]